MNMNDPIASLLGGWSTELNLYSVLLRVAVSVVFAAIIGCERASKRHAAGQRTFILVSLASTVAMMLDKSFAGTSMPLISAAAVSAIAIIAGATLGRRNGVMVGALAALTSNFFFGQGMWTPWQMFAMGLLGFFAGIIFSKKRNTLALCIYSFLSVLVIYGGIMNISSVLTYTTDINLQTITAYIVSGIPFDLIHAVSTVIFVLITGDALLKKCCRLRVKFGLFQ